MTYLCNFCQKPLIRENKSQRYHSECRKEKRRIENKEYQRKVKHRWVKPLADRKCECCGATYTPAKGIQKYCGAKCSKIIKEEYMKSWRLKKNANYKPAEQKSNAEDLLWPVPSPPQVPMFSGFLDRVMFQARTGAL